MTITLILSLIVVLSLASGIATLLYTRSDRGQAELRLAQMIKGE